MNQFITLNQLSESVANRMTTTITWTSITEAIDALPDHASTAEVIGVLEIIKRDLIEGLPKEES